MTPASKPSAAALRYAAPVSDALFAINERGLECAPIRGEDPAPIDNYEKNQEIENFEFAAKGPVIAHQKRQVQDAR